MRILSALFVGIFLLSAAVQWNDPDPLVWIAGYLVAAGTIPGAPSAAFTSFKMRASTHEEPREAVGLLICTVWTASLAVQGMRQSRSGAS